MPSSQLRSDRPLICQSPVMPGFTSSRRATSPSYRATSEGCNSCPPADRWLSKLNADPTVVALAFHVDYWDRLGWKDRFSSAALTARQQKYADGSKGGDIYTPQMVVDGQDAFVGSDLVDDAVVVCLDWTGTG